MDIIETKNKFSKAIFNLYYGIGIVAMGLLAVLVIFAVVMRYCFSLSWKSLAEFNVTVFAFTTFWSMGLCILKGEHVIIDIIYDGVKPAIKRWLSVVNYLIVLTVDLTFTFYAYKYTLMAGIQISQGMEIPMYFMYGIMPVSGIICAVCIIIKIIEFIKAPIAYFAPKNKVLTAEGGPDK
ncbi:MAG: TRAP transporter small permease subunit [Oscillospiraceae bacterium]|nr:TRAP transporter small permease subunit [Oscillospiraceae bacterium]